MTTDERRLALREERIQAAPYWGKVEPRIILTFLVFSVAWIGVIVLGVNGTIPLWLGLILNTVIASTF